jgi:hypothetical protein
VDETRPLQRTDVVDDVALTDLAFEILDGPKWLIVFGFVSW